MTESDEPTVTNAEPQPHQDQERGCDTKFNGMDREHGKSASLWLANNGTPPRGRIYAVDVFPAHRPSSQGRKPLSGSLNTPSARALIYKGLMEVATPNIEAFQTALTQRFKLTVENLMVMKSRPQILLCCMNQLASENLEQYYSPNRDVLLALHGCDDDNDTPTPPEISLRSIAVTKFVPGLRNDWPRSCTSLKWRLLQQQMLHHTVSVHKALEMTEAEIKIMDSEKRRDRSPQRERSRRGSASLPQRGRNRTNAKTQKHGESDIEAAHTRKR